MGGAGGGGSYELHCLTLDLLYLSLCVYVCVCVCVGVCVRGLSCVSVLYCMFDYVNGLNFQNLYVSVRHMIKLRQCPLGASVCECVCMRVCVCVCV